MATLLIEEDLGQIWKKNYVLLWMPMMSEMHRSPLWKPISSFLVLQTSQNGNFDDIPPQTHWSISVTQAGTSPRPHPQNAHCTEICFLPTKTLVLVSVASYPPPVRPRPVCSPLTPELCKYCLSYTSSVASVILRLEGK